MNWLLALLAFSGLMAVLSTIVSVSVEATHKIFDMRGQGLQEMLRALHDSVLVDIDKGRQPRSDVLRASGRSKDAARFANAMVKSPAYGGGGRPWWPSNWKLNLFSRKFESLSLRQFAEQLAQTEFGEKLVKADRSLVRHALARSAYEFDRFGVAQSQFFRRRAKAISGLAAFTFVLFANFNAIETYMYLATHEKSLDAIMATLDGGDAQALERRLVKLEATVTENAKAADASGGSAAALEAADPRALMNDFLDGSDLPVGKYYFPFCEAPTKDIKCKGNAAAPDRTWPFTTQATPEVVNQIMASPAEAIVWFMSLVATAGLLGLGAPFWFDIFRTVGALMGPQAVKRVKVSADDSDLAKAAAQPVGRGMEKPDLEELTDAFYVAAGVTMMPRSASGAIGLKLGPSSAEVTGAVQKPTEPPVTPDPSPQSPPPAPAPAAAPAAADAEQLPTRRLAAGWKKKKGAT